MNLNQVTLPTTDLERSIKFYEKLGLKLIVKALPHYARFECPEGDSTFSLHRVDEISNGEGAWVYFETEDLDGKVESLLAAGILLEELPVDKPWLWKEARLKDPDGNTIIIYFGGNNRKDPPWRLS